MANGDSINTTVQNFLSRIEAEEQVGLLVKAALRRLADTGQLSNQNAIETAGIVEARRNRPSAVRLRSDWR